MRILCATDLLPGSEAAMVRAGLLSGQLAADLTLLHVVSADESSQVLEQSLQEAFARTKSRAESLLWHTHRTAVVSVRVGNPARIVSDTAARSRTRLLILGPHRPRSMPDALDGTITGKAIAARACPVLVVRNESRQAYRRVLVALDFSEASVCAVRAAESLVLTPEADALVVHAGMTDAIRDLLRYESANFARYDIHAEKRLAAAGILQAVGRYSPDLLVVSTRGGGRSLRAMAGSAASRALHDASCDVLVVPEGSFGASRSKLSFGERVAGQARETGGL